MRNLAADCSIGFPFGGGKFWFPSPSEPWTKPAMRSFVLFCKMNKEEQENSNHTSMSTFK